MKWHSHISDFENALPNTGFHIEKAFDLYRDLIPKSRGKLVFVAGERGSGRGELLKALSDTFSKENRDVQIISGKFTEGKYLAISAKGKGFSRNADVAGNILSFLAKAVALKTGLPIDLILESTAFLFDFVGQLLQTSASVKGIIDELSENPPNAAEMPFAVKKLLRTAAKDSPVVCFFENFDEARFEWYEFVDSFAEEIGKDLPILFFLSLWAGAEPGKNQADESISEMVTRRAVSRGLADWWFMHPMTREEIAEWIGAETEPGMVGQLHGVTGGIPRWVRELWRDWKTNGFTHFNEDRRRWEWSENKRASLNPFNDILIDLIGLLLRTKDRDEVNEARELLATAAIEGKTFTAEALALATNRDPDDLIDFLDEFFVQNEENPSGILREEGFLTLETRPGITRNIFRYSFVSDWHVQVLNRYALTDKERANKRDEMITALKIAYAGDENLIAGSLSELYRNAGNLGLAAHFRTMASYSKRKEILYQQAKRLMTFKIDDWDKLQCYHYAKFLLEAGNATGHSIPLGESIEIFAHAEKVARKAEATDVMADAIYRSGFFYYSEHEITIARDKAEKSKELFEKVRNMWGISASLKLLAQIAHSEGDYRDAREMATESLSIDEVIGDRDGKVLCLHLLAHIAWSEGDNKGAKEKATESLLIQEIGDLNSKAVSLNLLAQIAHSEGDYKDAIEKATESLLIQEEVGDLHGKSSSLHVLAKIAHSEGDYKNARKKAAESLRIREQIGDRDGKASSLDVLGRIARDLDKPVLAIQLTSLCLFIFSHIGSGRAEIVRSDLVQLASDANVSEDQLKGFLEKAEAEYAKDEGYSCIDELLRKF